MATINNENVAVNDRVFDITHGSGIVVSTQYNDIVVKFDNGLRIAFDSTGSYAGLRRLYWHNPVVVEPPKDKRLWGTLVECIVSIHAHLYKK